MNDTLKAHLRSITAGASIRAMALRADLEPSTVQRQLDGDPKVQTVVAICRAYGQPLLPAFLAAGFITQQEASAVSIDAALRQVSDRQLVEEMLRRIAENEEDHPDLTEPVDGDLVDVAGLTEDEVRKQDLDTAANHDRSAEGLDPETT